MGRIAAVDRGFAARTRARSTGRETSLVAAESVAEVRPAVARRVLALFEQHGAMTQQCLIALYREHVGCQHVPESTIRTRVSELVAQKVLRDSGRRERIGSREAIVWEVLE